MSYCSADLAALETMEMLFNRMLGCNSSSGRRYNYIRMVELWENNPVVREVWDFCETAYKMVNRFVKKVVDVVKQIAENAAPALRVEWNGIQPMGEGIQQCYLVRLLDCNKDLIWSKVGTTKRKTVKRMTEHLRDYKKYGVRYIEVVRLWDCGGVEAEAFESTFRSHYIRKHPGTFRKNDRFTGVEFDLAEADKIFENLRNEA